MVIRESTELTQDYAFDVRYPWTFNPNASPRYIHRKTITYDSDPTTELEEWKEDGWVVEKTEINHYYGGPHYEVTLKCDAEIPDGIRTEIPIPSSEELLRQISELFEDKWNTI